MPVCSSLYSKEERYDENLQCIDNGFGHHGDGVPVADTLKHYAVTVGERILLPCNSRADYPEAASGNALAMKFNPRPAKAFSQKR
jgi:hypothetical protein